MKILSGKYKLKQRLDEVEKIRKENNKILNKKKIQYLKEEKFTYGSTQKLQSLKEEYEHVKDIQAIIEEYIAELTYRFEMFKR